VFHLAALVGAIVVPPTVKLVALAVGLYLVRMFWVTAGFHRYFSHRSYKTSRAMQLVIGILANMSLMRGPLDWASHHRFHHRHSDTERDLHSPGNRGFWWSHCGWFLSREVEGIRLFPVRDLDKFPELVWLNRHYYLPAYTVAAVLAAIGGWPYFVWGFLVSTILTWNVAFTINSLSHMFGSRRFKTRDDSRNNPLLAALTLGEGWHNNHHHAMHAAKHGLAWWEIDVTWLGLVVMEKLGLVWDLRPGPALDEADETTRERAQPETEPAE
jgi:stearoyl-CoA desaturase (delta-9 desaturase)